MSAGVPLAMADLREAALQRRLHELLGEDPAPARRPEDILGYLPDYSMGQELFGEPSDYYSPVEELQAAECKLEPSDDVVHLGVALVVGGRSKGLLIAMMSLSGAGQPWQRLETGTVGRCPMRACLQLASVQQMGLPFIPESW